MVAALLGNLLGLPRGAVVEPWADDVQRRLGQRYLGVGGALVVVSAALTLVPALLALKVSFIPLNVAPVYILYLTYHLGAFYTWMNIRQLENPNIAFTLRERVGTLKRAHLLERLFLRWSRFAVYGCLLATFVLLVRVGNTGVEAPEYVYSALGVQHPEAPERTRALRKAHKVVSQATRNAWLASELRNVVGKGQQHFARFVVHRSTELADARSRLPRPNTCDADVQALRRARGAAAALRSNSNFAGCWTSRVARSLAEVDGFLRSAERSECSESIRTAARRLGARLDRVIGQRLAVASCEGDCIETATRYVTTQEACDGPDEDPCKDGRFACDPQRAQLLCLELPQRPGAQTLWRDRDGDGFGDDSDAIEWCAANGEPGPDLATRAGDCDDENALRHPAQKKFAGDAIAGSYDYNCDGEEEVERQAYRCDDEQFVEGWRVYPVTCGTWEAFAVSCDATRSPPVQFEQRRVRCL